MNQGRKAHDGAGADADLLERPLSPRSVVASLLLGQHPPRQRAAVLVRLCAEFGISEGTTRVALSRMVAAGELRADGGRYELAGSLRRKQAGQDLALAPDVRPWDGQWRIGIVAAERRAVGERAALREAAGRAHYVEVREGVWARPDNLPVDRTDP